MTGTYQVFTYADDVNLIGSFIKTVERNVCLLLNSCNDTGLAAKIGKTKYIDIGRHRGIMANEHITVGSNSCKKVKTFKYLGSLLTIQNYFQA